MVCSGSKEGKSRKGKGCVVVARKVKIGKKGIEYLQKFKFSNVCDRDSVSLMQIEI